MPSHVGSYDRKGNPDNFLHLFEGAIRMKKWVMLVACHMFTYTINDSSRIWWNGQKTVFLWLFIHVIRVFRVIESCNILNKGDGPVRSIEKDALDARMIRLKGQVNAATGASKPRMATSESTSLNMNTSMEGVVDVEEAVWLSHVAGDKLTMRDFAFDNFPTLTESQKWADLVRTLNIQDIDDFVQDLQLGKHELWPLLSKEKGNEITYIVCNRYVVLSESASILKGAPIVYDQSTKAVPNADDIYLIRILLVILLYKQWTSIPSLHPMLRLAFPVVEYYARNNWVFKEDGIILIATFIGKLIMLDSYNSSMCKDSWGRSSFARCLIKVNSEADLMDSVTIGIPSLTRDSFTKETICVEYKWRPPRCNVCNIFGHVYDHCPNKLVSPPIVSTSNVVALIVEKSNDGFQMVGKKKKRKGKSKSTNGGQFAGPFVKQTIKYEPKLTLSAPKKGATNVSNPLMCCS
ncbi:hypothetical protein Tco_0719727 [Tanacetum coccineum]